MRAGRSVVTHFHGHRACLPLHEGCTQLQMWHCATNIG